MSKIKFQRKHLSIPYAAFLLLFVVLPLILIVYYALTDVNGTISLKNFINFFKDKNIEIYQLCQDQSYATGRDFSSKNKQIFFEF